MDLLELDNRDTNSMFRHPWEQARLKIVCDMINGLVDKVGNTDNINIIDIGCGDLFVLEALADRFSFNYYYGVDISFTEKQLHQFNEELNIKKIHAYKNIEDVEVEEDSFSIILLLDVVEHIKDDHAFLKSLYNCTFLNDQSRIIITVPSYNSLFAEHDDILLHFRRYNNRELIELVHANSFAVIDNGYFFMSLLLPRLISVLKEKVFKKNSKTKTGLSSWSHGYMTTKIITTFLLTDYYFFKCFKRININFPGLSNYAICKK